IWEGRKPGYVSGHPNISMRSTRKCNPSILAGGGGFGEGERMGSAWRRRTLVASLQSSRRKTAPAFRYGDGGRRIGRGRWWKGNCRRWGEQGRRGEANRRSDR